jgi:hypothetical protein
MAAAGMRFPIIELVQPSVVFATLAIAVAQTPAIPWNIPLTPDGHPDLQGNWLNKSATPLERPKELADRQVLTDDEVIELKRRAERLFKDGRSDYAGGNELLPAVLANPEQFKSPRAITNSDAMIEREFDNRTSLIVDPPDGKLPPYTPAGQQRWAAFMSADVGKDIAAGREGLTPAHRCITMGVPRLVADGEGVAGLYQILQSPGYVVLFMEAIHDARIIPLEGRPHLPQGIRTWNGDSRGRWEGNTLVVDTANFSAKARFLGSAEGLHLIERFTRVAPDEIRYEITVEDRTTWVSPWTALVRLKRTEDRIYEYACHEGNAQIIETMLSGARSSEKISEEAAKKK